MYSDEAVETSEASYCSLHIIQLSSNPELFSFYIPLEQGPSASLRAQTWWSPHIRARENALVSLTPLNLRAGVTSSRPASSDPSPQSV